MMSIVPTMPAPEAQRTRHGQSSEEPKLSVANRFEP